MLFIYEIRKAVFTTHARQHRAALREYLLYTTFFGCISYNIFLALYIVHCGSPSCERQSFLYTRPFFFFIIIGLQRFLFCVCVVQGRRVYSRVPG